MKTEALKVLQVHNRYLTGLGGEDFVLDQESVMLREQGHEVDQLFVTTQSEDVDGFRSKLQTGMKTVWSREGYRLVAERIAQFQPDVIHVHNTFPLLSPSIYSAAQKANVPLVQTLHNYRLTCANGLLQRENRPCEECVGRFPLPALRHKCYRGSLVSTLPMVAMQVGNRANGSYGKVSAYITLNEFSKKLMTRAGLPAAKIHVKPNFIPDPLKNQAINTRRQKTFVCVGKLVKEKAIDFLIDAWKTLAPHDYTLIVIGDGIERDDLHRRAQGLDNIQWVGWQDKPSVLKTVQNASFLVLSSRCYEGQPMVLIEALSVGTPTVVPSLGAIPELTDNQRAGIVFEGGNVPSLKAALEQAMHTDASAWARMSQAGRNYYVSKFTVETNYQILMSIYERVIREAKTP
jgi:glycosyltransferase involved in cell wall biosynthesis